VLGLSIVSLSVIFLLDFGTVPTVWYILFFTLLGKRFKTLTFRLYDRSRDSGTVQNLTKEYLTVGTVQNLTKEYLTVGTVQNLTKEYLTVGTVQNLTKEYLTVVLLLNFELFQR
jgi:hypothetical protein